MNYSANQPSLPPFHPQMYAWLPSYKHRISQSTKVVLSLVGGLSSASASGKNVSQKDVLEVNVRYVIFPVGELYTGGAIVCTIQDQLAVCLKKNDIVSGDAAFNAHAQQACFLKEDFLSW